MQGHVHDAEHLNTIAEYVMGNKDLLIRIAEVNSDQTLKTLVKLSRVHKDSRNVLKHLIKKQIDQIEECIRYKLCCKSDSEWGTTLNQKCPTELFQYLFDIDALNNFNQWNLTFIPSDDNETHKFPNVRICNQLVYPIENGCDDIIYEGVPHIERIKYYAQQGEYFLKIATFAALMQARDMRCKKLEIRCDFMTETALAVYGTRVFNETIRTREQTKFRERYSSIGQLMCEVIQKYEEVDIIFKVFVSSIQDFTRYKPSSLQGQIIYFLKNKQNRIRYRVGLIISSFNGNLYDEHELRNEVVQNGLVGFVHVPNDMHEEGRNLYFELL